MHFDGDQIAVDTKDSGRRNSSKHDEAPENNCSKAMNEYGRPLHHSHDRETHRHAGSRTTVTNGYDTGIRGLLRPALAGCSAPFLLLRRSSAAFATAYLGLLRTVFAPASLLGCVRYRLSRVAPHRFCSCVAPRRRSLPRARYVGDLAWERAQAMLPLRYAVVSGNFCATTSPNHDGT